MTAIPTDLCADCGTALTFAVAHPDRCWGWDAAIRWHRELCEPCASARIARGRITRGAGRCAGCSATEIRTLVNCDNTTCDRTRELAP